MSAHVRCTCLQAFGLPCPVHPPRKLAKASVRIVLNRETYDAALKRLCNAWVGGPTELPAVIAMWR